MLASLLLLGGNFNNGTNDGVFYFNCNNAFSNSNLNYGARLLIVAVLVSVWNAINDPTTEGDSDSKQALTYNTPKKSRYGG